jgi:hypothetical protein
MVEKLGRFDQWLFGGWADRAAINRNADELSTVEADLTALQALVKRQAQEILQLRATVMGIVEVLHDKTPFDDKELERAVQAAWAKLTAPPPKPLSTTDPYRGIPSEQPTVDDIAAATALLADAQKHHSTKQFRRACEIYQQVIDRYPETKEAGIARQQLENLSKA